MSSPWHFLNLRDLPIDEWNSLLASAEVLAGPRGREPLLAGKRLAMVFFNASLRTRTAFEVAASDLGAHAVYLQVGGGLWDMETRDGVVMDGDRAEHVREGIGVLSRMVDGLGVRAFAKMEDAAEDARDPVLASVVKASSVPVLSLESAMDHPHQGLADALTVRRKTAFQKVKVVVTWAPHVKPLPMAVPHAAVLAFAREGHDVVVTHPDGYDLDGGVLECAVELAEESGGSLDVTTDRDAAVQGARVVYAKSWGATQHYGNEARAMANLQAHRAWMVTERVMDRTDDAFFMHCLPVRRGVVVTDGVLDSLNSIVLDQGAARLDVQRATLCRAMNVEA